MLDSGVVRIAPRTKVTFLAPGSRVAIDFVANNSSDICRAAETLKARYFIAQDGLNSELMLPVWGVFDLRRCHKDNPTPGTWTLARPLKTFTHETDDAAVMYALALLGRV